MRIRVQAILADSTNFISKLRSGDTRRMPSSILKKKDVRRCGRFVLRQFLFFGGTESTWFSRGLLCDVECIYGERTRAQSDADNSWTQSFLLPT